MKHINYNLDANQISYLIKILLIGLRFLLQLLLSERLALRALARKSACCISLCIIFLTELHSSLALGAHVDGDRQAARDQVILERW